MKTVSDLLLALRVSWRTEITIIFELFNYNLLSAMQTRLPMQISERRMMEFTRSSHFSLALRFLLLLLQIIIIFSRLLSQSFIVTGCSGCVWFNFQVFYTTAICVLCSMWDIRLDWKATEREKYWKKDTHLFVSFGTMNEEMNHVDPLFMRAYFYVYLCLRFVWIGFPTAIRTTNQLKTNNNNDKIKCLASFWWYSITVCSFNVL